MNKDNLDRMTQNYIENYAYFNDPQGGYETYKWDAVAQVQSVWNLDTEDLAGMIKKSFSKTYNLINNRIVSPGNGLALLAKEDPETVRKSLKKLLTETRDADEKQNQIINFVDEINGLLEKHFPGKWKYAHDIRVAITYLALIHPDQNYLFKSTPAHYFAKWMDFPTDIGYGNNFKLKFYYQMCDELLDYVNSCPDILAKDAERKTAWKDISHHILVTDLIYCFGTYPFMRSGLNEPVPRVKKVSGKPAAIDRIALAAKLNDEIEKLQDQIDAVEKEKAELPMIDLKGKSVKTKAFGTVIIERQDGSYLYFSASGKERQFALPDCVCNGYMNLEDENSTERCRKEYELNERLKALNSEQRIKTYELAKLQ